MQRTLDRYNRAFYERRWRVATVLAMPRAAGVGEERGPLVEVGSGLRPRLPLGRAVFVEVSRAACVKLRRAGAEVVRARLEALPFASGSLGAIHTYDLLEHLEDDRAAAREIGRVLRPGGRLVLSTPLHHQRWQQFDWIVGHARRYEPAALVALIGEQGLALEGFAPFGLRPRSRLLNRLGLYYLTRRPRLALQFEERFLRLLRGPEEVLIVERGGIEAFLRRAAAMDGAVTVWRRLG